MVSMIFWQAEDTGRGTGGVLEHRVKGGLYCFTTISKLPSRPESASAGVDYPQRLRVRHTETGRSTADCDDDDCQHYGHKKCNLKEYSSQFRDFSNFGNMTTHPEGTATSPSGQATASKIKSVQCTTRNRPTRRIITLHTLLLHSRQRPFKVVNKIDMRRRRRLPKIINAFPIR